MKGQHDPVDNALKLLRSDQWAAEPFDIELENKFMRANHVNKQASRFGFSRALIVSLALFVVGGATFAATGGAATLKNWLLKIEVNGELTEVTLAQTEADEDGVHTFTIDTQDGGVATVQVQQTVDVEDGEMTRIEVTLDGETEQTTRVMKKCTILARTPGATEDDLGDTEPTHEWTDADGQVNKLYVLSDEEGAGSRVFLGIPNEEGTPEVHFLTATPFPLVGEGIETAIDVGEDGMVTISINDGDADARVIKFMMQRAEESPKCRLPLNVGTANGEIKIRLEEVEDDQ